MGNIVKIIEISTTRDFIPKRDKILVLSNPDLDELHIRQDKEINKFLYYYEFEKFDFNKEYDYTNYAAFFFIFEKDSLEEKVNSDMFDLVIKIRKKIKMSLLIRENVKNMNFYSVVFKNSYNDFCYFDEEKYTKDTISKFQKFNLECAISDSISYMEKRNIETKDVKF